MGQSKSRLRQLREASPRQAARLLWRKAIYRKVLMGEFGVKAGDTQALGVASPYPITFLVRDEWPRALENNPHLSQTDLDRFIAQKATCIVASDGERLAASTWMIEGPDDVFVDDLHRSVRVAANQHFSCRSFVDPDYRGHALLSHMIHEYSTSVPADNSVWGLVFRWNIASFTSLERLGWRHRGDYWTTFVFGRKYFGERNFEPRPAITLGHPLP